jgi:hypothetical protein
MNTQIYYLNNSGSKWITLPKEQIRLISFADNYDKIRKVEYYESFGNFGAIVLKYKGKRISLLADHKDKNGLTMLFVDYKERINPTNYDRIDNL